MLKTRVITAVVLLAVLLAALFFLPSLGWAVFCALICALAAWEWGGLAGWGGKARVVYGIVLGCLCFALLYILFQPFCASLQDGVLYQFVITPRHLWWSILWLSIFLLTGLFWLLAVPLWLWHKWRLHGWFAALIGILVLVPASMAFFALREETEPFTEPFVLLLAVCALVWVADIAAYFSGRAFGGKKLAPNISPGKTWAGAFGAVIGVLVYCNVILWLVPNKLEMQHVLFFQPIFIVLAVWSIIGDLFESLLKRQAGVKDSSNLLPGHGGILDRIDSLTSTLALVVFINSVVFLFSSSSLLK